MDGVGLEEFWDPFHPKPLWDCAIPNLGAAEPRPRLDLGSQTLPAELPKGSGMGSAGNEDVMRRLHCIKSWPGLTPRGRRAALIHDFTKCAFPTFSRLFPASPGH